MIKIESNRFEIRADGLFLRIGLILALMACVSISLIFPIFSEFDGSVGDICAVAFISIWLSLVIFGAVSSFHNYSRRLTVDGDGVSYRSLFEKRKLSWSEISDFGLAYDGRSHEGGNFSSVYIVYFASSVQSDFGRYRKRLSRDAIKIRILADDCHLFATYVLPYCTERTSVTPFMPE